MSDKVYELKYDELMKYIRQNQLISVPQLQVECELTYPEAQEVMAYLEEKHLVAVCGDSIEREVDTLRMNAAELEIEKCFELYTNESSELLDFVIILHERANGDDVELSGGTELYADLYVRAESLGLAHTFDGQWYSSISDKSVERLKIILNEGGSLLTAAIARPVFDACREGRLDAGMILECCLLPDFCRMLIENWLKNYGEAGVLPNDDKRVLLSYAQRDEVADELFDMYIKKYEFSTKWEYLAQAKQALETLIDNPAVPLYFKLAAKEVVRRLDTEYDGESLEKYRRKLITGVDEDDLLMDDDWLDDFDFFDDEDDDADDDE